MRDASAFRDDTKRLRKATFTWQTKVGKLKWLVCVNSTKTVSKHVSKLLYSRDLRALHTMADERQDGHEALIKSNEEVRYCSAV